MIAAAAGPAAPLRLPWRTEGRAKDTSTNGLRVRDVWALRFLRFLGWLGGIGACRRDGSAGGAHRSRQDGESQQLVIEPPCPPCTSHAASIRQPFGAVYARWLAGTIRTDDEMNRNVGESQPLPLF
jgi:hypothetical protein